MKIISGIFPGNLLYLWSMSVPKIVVCVNHGTNVDWLKIFVIEQPGN